MELILNEFLIPELASIVNEYANDQWFKKYDLVMKDLNTITTNIDNLYYDYYTDETRDGVLLERLEPSDMYVYLCDPRIFLVEKEMCSRCNYVATFHKEKCFNHSTCTKSVTVCLECYDETKYCLEHEPDDD